MRIPSNGLFRMRRAALAQLPPVGALRRDGVLRILGRSRSHRRGRDNYIRSRLLRSGRSPRPAAVARGIARAAFGIVTILTIPIPLPILRRGIHHAWGAIMIAAKVSPVAVVPPTFGDRI